MEHIVGGLVGIALSIIVWAFKFHLLRPRLRFSDYVSRIDRGGKPEYRIKIANRGRRAIVDIRLDCVVVIPRFDPAYANSAVFKVALSTESIPILERRTTHGPRVRLVTLGQGALTPFSLERLRQVAPAPPTPSYSPTVEELVGWNERAYLRVRIIGHDNLTGAPAVFQSPKYTSSKIMDARFGKGVLEVSGKTRRSESPART